MLGAGAALVALVLGVALSRGGRHAVPPTAAQARCSADREALKTLVEADAGAVNLGSVQPATISQLLALPAPSDLPAVTRIAPTELGVRSVSVTMISARLQSDGSIHVLLADPAGSSGSPELAAEFPVATACGSSANRAAAQAMSDAREALVTAFGLPSATGDAPLWRTATLDAALLFMRPADQPGSAGNGIELAPVLGLHLGTATAPVTRADLQAATAAYRQDVATALQTLTGQTDALAAAVDAGDLERARSLWLDAHLGYVRLGAAYDTFGAFDTRIAGRADGLAMGVDDPAFAGFLRLEYGLWHGQTAGQLAPIADQLAVNVHGLVTAFSGLQTDPLDLPRRAHEILENGLQFELTGDADEGSHTTLATLRADVDATRAVLAPLEPVIRPRQPVLWTVVTAGLSALAARLDAFRQPDGSWLPLAQLTRSQREQLNGTVGQLLEQLAEVPDAAAPAPGP
jgi:hypothetical protein